MLNKDAPVLRAEVAVLLAKDAIEPVPPAEMKSGFYSPYFIVPKKGSGLRPILDLRVLNRALHKLPFGMLTQRRIFQCIRPFDWFAAIDLKDAYFHVSILPRHRPFLRFAFKGRAYQYKALPFGLSLSPRVFTKVVEAALVPLREAGIRILNYLDDWLILAQSRALLCKHRYMVLSHLSRLGLQVLLYQQMPLPRAEGPCATGMQLRGSGQGPSCSGISTASSCWQYGLLCAASKRCYMRSMYWSIRTTLRPLRTSTTKAVYAPVACRNSPAISSFEVRST